MEPFGLLNFLKTLLPSMEEEQKNNQANDNESPPAPPQKEEEKENAYVLFLEAHERRAKRK